MKPIQDLSVQTMRYGNKTLGPRLRLTLRKGVAFGPGKADLLEGIRDTGSIAAAGRHMKMSYTRAWGLVSEMNAEFRAPLVESTKGGAVRGGATLTPLGEDVLKRYRRMERGAARAVAVDLAALRKSLF
jgi:molybdate transport system regulatory protein